MSPPKIRVPRRCLAGACRGRKVLRKRSPFREYDAPFVCVCVSFFLRPCFFVFRCESAPPPPNVGVMG